MLATKIHDTAAAAGWLSALNPGQCLLAAQNGVGHRERVAPLTRATVVPVLVYVNAERTGRGCVRARVTGRGLVLPDDAPGRSAASLFSGSALAVETVPDFRTASWEKLLSNVTANPLTALTGRRAEVLRGPPVAALAMDLLRETVAVARAEGASLPDDAAPDMLAWLQALPPGAAPRTCCKTARQAASSSTTGSSARSSTAASDTASPPPPSGLSWPSSAPCPHRPGRACDSRRRPDGPDPRLRELARTPTAPTAQRRFPLCFA